MNAHAATELMTGVQLNRVYRLYGAGDAQVRALVDVTLQINPGEFVSLYGPSGSGKTTLLNVIGGLDNVSSGEVIVDGSRIDLMGKSEKAKYRLSKVGFVFQAYNLLPVLSACENVEFVMELQGVASNERRERALSILEEVGLGGLGHRRPAQLSGGQQQRVAVARAMVTNPALILADEPTANLDSKSSEKLIETMSEMNSRHGVTFIFATHDPLVMKNARRLIQLRDGAIVSDENQS